MSNKLLDKIRLLSPNPLKEEYRVEFNPNGHTIANALMSITPKRSEEITNVVAKEMPNLVGKTNRVQIFEDILKSVNPQTIDEFFLTAFTTGGADFATYNDDVQDSLKNLLSKLTDNNGGFNHKSVAVNLAQIEKIRSPKDALEYAVQNLENGEVISKEEQELHDTLLLQNEELIEATVHGLIVIKEKLKMDDHAILKSAVASAFVMGYRESMNAESSVKPNRKKRVVN